MLVREILPSFWTGCCAKDGNYCSKSGARGLRAAESDSPIDLKLRTMLKLAILKFWVQAHSKVVWSSFVVLRKAVFGQFVQNIYMTVCCWTDRSIESSCWGELAKISTQSQLLAVAHSHIFTFQLYHILKLSHFTCTTFSYCQILTFQL